MNAYEKLEKLKDSDFKLITGVTRKVFNEILDVLRKAKEKSEKNGGPKGLSPELRLTLALEYWREYRSMRHMANDHQIPKSTICRAILWVEDVLSDSEEFKLKDLKERFKPDNNENPIQIVLIDVEEQPIERPKYEQKASYSGKKTAYDKVSNFS